MPTPLSSFPSEEVITSPLNASTPTKFTLSARSTVFAAFTFFPSVELEVPTNLPSAPLNRPSTCSKTFTILVNNPPNSYDSGGASADTFEDSGHCSRLWWSGVGCEQGGFRRGVGSTEQNSPGCLTISMGGGVGSSEKSSPDDSAGGGGISQAEGRCKRTTLHAPSPRSIRGDNPDDTTSDPSSSPASMSPPYSANLARSRVRARTSVKVKDPEATRKRDQDNVHSPLEMLR